MRRSQIVVLVFIAALVFSAAVVATASAETTLLAEWLLNGAGVTELLPTIVIGEFILGDKSNGARVQCSYILDGSVGPNGENEETEALTLAKVAITEAAPLLCKTLKTCEASETDIEASASKLPWHTFAFLSSNGAFLEMVLGETWKISCLVLGIKITDECTFPETTFGLKNVAAGVEIIGLSTPLGNCSVGGKETGEIEAGSGDGDDSMTGTLAVSSE
jgi:hypothetical protein